MSKKGLLERYRCAKKSPKPSKQFVYSKPKYPKIKLVSLYKNKNVLYEKIKIKKRPSRKSSRKTSRKTCNRRKSQRRSKKSIKLKIHPMETKECDVERVLFSIGNGKNVWYLVKWRGYSILESLFIPHKDTTNCAEYRGVFNKLKPKVTVSVPKDITLEYALNNTREFIKRIFKVSAVVGDEYDLVNKKTGDRDFYKVYWKNFPKALYTYEPFGYLYENDAYVPLKYNKKNRLRRTGKEELYNV